MREYRSGKGLMRKVRRGCCWSRGRRSRERGEEGRRLMGERERAWVGVRRWAESSMGEAEGDRKSVV